MRELKPIVVDKENVKWEDIDTLRQLHIKEAGRETRSEASWRLQYQMVRAGEAFVVIGNLQNQPVSAGLYLVNRTNCNYWVSASRRDLFQKPLFHALMWTAILHAKALGCRWFEMGQEVHPSFTMERAPTQKELDISRFKTGFGGETRVYLDLELRHR